MCNDFNRCLIMCEQHNPNIDVMLKLIESKSLKAAADAMSAKPTESPVCCTIIFTVNWFVTVHVFVVQAEYALLRWALAVICGYAPPSPTPKPEPAGDPVVRWNIESDSEHDLTKVDIAVPAPTPSKTVTVSTTATTTTRPPGGGSGGSGVNNIDQDNNNMTATTPSALTFKDKLSTGVEVQKLNTWGLAQKRVLKIEDIPGDLQLYWHKSGMEWRRDAEACLKVRVLVLQIKKQTVTVNDSCRLD